MRIKGEIFHKRRYKPIENQDANYILFVKVSGQLLWDGDHLKTIPVLISKSNLTQEVGDMIEVEGTIKLQPIQTVFGNFSISPLPVLIPNYSTSIRLV